MKTIRLMFLLNVLCLLSFTSCSRPGDKVWDDTKSCGRHVKRGLCSLGGKQGDSRQIRCKEDFLCQNGDVFANNYDDFIPLVDDNADNDVAMGEITTRQPKQSPGDPGSFIPGIEAFKDPSKIPQLSAIFRKIEFPYDSSLIKGQTGLGIINAIANYMKENPNTYIFVEGHCDNRGAVAYNLALGARRANSVRNALIQEGVSPDNIFTISYGKERPLVQGNDENAWAKNRRAEFKVYQR